MVQLKIRKTNKDGHIRLESKGTIKEVLINEDIVRPNKETISVCFRGTTSSGVIDFSPKELEMLYNTVRERMHLIKGVKEI
ncbi:MAG: hypothetical protein R6V53_03975 [Candidatus Woesearchaeota archaeon]